MPEDLARVRARLDALLARGIRGNLIPRGLARAIIWRDGEMPADGPPFAAELSEDLLDYGYTLLRLGLVLREAATDLPLSVTAFERAGEAIESVVRNGDPQDRERGMHRVVAACAYHLAHFSARSFSLLPSPDGLNLSPMEIALCQLLRRSLSDLRETCRRSLLDVEREDPAIAQRLADPDDETELDDVFQFGLTAEFLRAIASFDFALLTGDPTVAAAAIEQFSECESAAADLNFVASWWSAKLAKNLVSDLWQHSMHEQIPPAVPGDGQAEWLQMRELFIGLLQSRRVAEIELWPSQLEAAKRAINTTDDLVVSLPTSAGKTRIAELCILRALTTGKRVVYVTPLRALSAQIERDLRQTFVALGFTVSSLYGASGEVGLDTDTLSNRHIVVATPEKLDFAVRQDASLLDNVGLIVLDEAHTIGPGEREVRYEVLVQRLLRRSDAATRRIVCLSAILPQGEQLNDFVSWIRQGDPGDPIVAQWRPTRQRFGTVTWRQNYGLRSQRGPYGQLDLDVEGERTWVPRFVTQQKVPKARTRMFPNDSPELAIATTWQTIREGRSVLIFCPQKNLVVSLAKKILDLYQRDALESVVENSPDLDRARRIGAEWLGTEHPAVRCLDVGVAIHHAGLPKAFLREIEGLLINRTLPVVVASPTLAQGLNLSASTLLMYSIRRGTRVISGEDFGNVIGRAGRARVDLDGQILYALFEPTQWRLQQWENLKDAARFRSIQSGLYELIAIVVERITRSLGLSPSELLEYVAGNTDIWDHVFATPDEGEEDDEAASTFQTLASLDSAIFALTERLDCDPSELPALLDDILTDSLWTKTLARKTDAERDLQRAILIERGVALWSSSTAAQRRGYFAAGVGLATGRELDQRADELNNLLFEAEQELDRDFDEAVNHVTAFATIVFSIRPFAPKAQPSGWQQVLRDWMAGRPMAEIVAPDPELLVEFIEDAIVYRLVWAIEAIRVRARAHGDVFADILSGRVAQTLEAGTRNQNAMILLHAGLSSRTAALAATEAVPADFSDYQGMKNWVLSLAVRRATASRHWPTAETADIWRQFVRSLAGESTRRWRRNVTQQPVMWHEAKPHTGDLVRLVRRETGDFEVLTRDFRPLGEITQVSRSEPAGILFGRVIASAARLEVHHLGPGTLF